MTETGVGPGGDGSPMELDEYVGRVGEPLRALGGAFMLDRATIGRARELGLDFAGFYGVGRTGVLGDVDADVAAAAMVFFEPAMVRSVRDAAISRAKLTPTDAATEFMESCRVWGRAHLAGADGLDELCALAERVGAAASPAAAPLFAGWRAMPLPDDAPGRAAQLCHVLREHRGGAHGVAVVASGLSPLEAVVANGGPETAALYGWPEPYPEPDARRAARAEALTDRLAAPAYGALGEAERASLLELLDRAAAAAGLTGDGAPDRIRDARRAVEGP